MPELKCPHCGKTFQVDETDYSNIVSQVRNAEFNKEIEQRESSFQARLDVALKQQENEMNLEIGRLKDASKSFETEKALAVQKAEQAKDLEIGNLKNQIVTLKDQIKTAVDQKENEYTKKLNDAENEKANLRQQLNAKENEKNTALALKDQEIQQIKDFKSQQSVKLIGEDLEQHCLNEFNTYRMGAFPNAIFAKDNTTPDHTKGDFIFRDYDDDGTEIVSIMFDMKNEDPNSVNKQKNEAFFKKLDKDRNDKDCEYAVLVSVLEPESDFYNNGIADVSFQYPKMYVIRPQFFIPLITLLRNAAKNSLQAKKELIYQQEQNRDYTNFEEDLESFKESFWGTYTNAKNRHDDAVNEIDKIIKELTKMRDALTTSNSHLDAAAHKVDDITVKKLTKRSPRVLEQIEDARDKKLDK